MNHYRDYTTPRWDRTAVLDEDTGDTSEITDKQVAKINAKLKATPSSGKTSWRNTTSAHTLPRSLSRQIAQKASQKDQMKNSGKGKKGSFYLPLVTGSNPGGKWKTHVPLVSVAKAVKSAFFEDTYLFVFHELLDDGFSIDNALIKLIEIQLDERPGGTGDMVRREAAKFQKQTANAPQGQSTGAIKKGQFVPTAPNAAVAADTGARNQGLGGQPPAAAPAGNAQPAAGSAPQSMGPTGNYSQGASDAEAGRRVDAFNSLETGSFNGAAAKTPSRADVDQKMQTDYNAQNPVSQTASGTANQGQSTGAAGSPSLDFSKAPGNEAPKTQAGQQAAGRAAVPQATIRANEPQSVGAPAAPAGNQQSMAPTAPTAPAGNQQTMAAPVGNQQTMARPAAPGGAQQTMAAPAAPTTGGPTNLDRAAGKMQARSAMKQDTQGGQSMGSAGAYNPASTPGAGSGAQTAGSVSSPQSIGKPAAPAAKPAAPAQSTKGISKRGLAFRAARAAGKEKFDFGGKSFHTRQAGEKPGAWKSKMAGNAKTATKVPAAAPAAPAASSGGAPQSIGKAGAFSPSAGGTDTGTGQSIGGGVGATSKIGTGPGTATSKIGTPSSHSDPGSSPQSFGTAGKFKPSFPAPKSTSSATTKPQPKPQMTTGSPGPKLASQGAKPAAPKMSIGKPGGPQTPSSVGPKPSLPKAVGV